MLMGVGEWKMAEVDRSGLGVLYRRAGGWTRRQITRQINCLSRGEKEAAVSQISRCSWKPTDRRFVHGRK
ncbi:uncharacterized protein LY79DRAFT_534907 [Colletotrichum navitas]|uniref:Uncharacterized protein n=1 Tax=Colletotrichum navitas TaxID=681940 RepID=A0AAD8QD48_9PEZI|nr:uncharacterized protein LY79DRAFT_534907 [Colletotrichum navitas]KAK1599382.1 hypothetical protein LY79DRAFT_534907 [Colletotrichum navitas]